MKKSVLTFGEILLRLSPEMGGAWIRNASIPTFVGGAELNTATALANWNVPVQYCSGLPKNALAEEIVSHLGSKNIDTSKMQWCGERIGIYMLPQGADLKNAGVIYDRAHSSFASIQVGQINWSEVFKDVEWLHISAITPALSQQMADVCLEAVKEAKKSGSKNICRSQLPLQTLEIRQRTFGNNARNSPILRPNNGQSVGCKQAFGYAD